MLENEQNKCSLSNCLKNPDLDCLIQPCDCSSTWIGQLQVFNKDIKMGHLGLKCPYIPFSNTSVFPPIVHQTPSQAAGVWSRMMESSVLLQQLPGKGLIYHKSGFSWALFHSFMLSKWLKGCALLWNYRTALLGTCSGSEGAIITSQKNLFGSTKEKLIPPSSLGRKMDYSSCDVQSSSAFPDNTLDFYRS